MRLFHPSARARAFGEPAVLITIGQPGLQHLEKWGQRGLRMRGQKIGHIVQQRGAQLWRGESLEPTEFDALEIGPRADELVGVGGWCRVSSVRGRDNGHD